MTGQQQCPTREQIAPLPDDARMDAYYYGFDRTGVGFIDAILSAVAIAGKGAHHTESWGAPWDGTTDYFRGHPGLPDAEDAVDLIQKAAQQAADAVLALFPQPSQAAEPPRIEDMAPGTTFSEVTRWTVRRDTGGYLYARGDAADRYLNSFDPSTIRDVRGPQ